MTAALFAPGAHTDDIDRFCRTDVFGELPPGQYQCPACGVAWKGKQSKYRVIRYGRDDSEMAFIPGKVECVRVEGRL